MLGVLLPLHSTVVSQKKCVFLPQVQIPFDTYFSVEAVNEFVPAITMEKFMEEVAQYVWPPEERRGETDHTSFSGWNSAFVLSRARAKEHNDLRTKSCDPDLEDRRVKFVAELTGNFLNCRTLCFLLLIHHCFVSVFCYSERHGQEESSCNAKEGNPFGPFWDNFKIDFVASEFYGPLYYDTEEKQSSMNWRKK